MKGKTEKNQLKTNIEKKLRPTLVNSTNPQPRIWDQDNFIKRKTEKIMKLKAQ
jgi:hypothetical protein